MALAGGIDLGGTKIEARLFDPGDNWSVLNSQEVVTPRESYDALVTALAEQVGWLAGLGAVSVGLGAPGLVGADGLVVTANLPATGRPLPSDLASACGRPVPVINDCRAFSYSEARLGAGRDADRVLGFVIGTGLAGGLVTGGTLHTGPNGQAGEYGHMPLSHAAVTRYALPLLPCGCGAIGCYETLCSGPGLERIATALGIEGARTRDLVQSRDHAAATVLDVWTDLTTELLCTLCAVCDPDVIVFGGGLSHMPGLTDRLDKSLRPKLLKGTRAPEMRLAEGGDRSGARGAALFAWDMNGGDA